MTLPNGTTFTPRYERISRKQVPINIHAKNAKKIGPRNIKIKTGLTVPARKNVRFVPTQQHKTGSVELKKKSARMKKRQSGKGLASDLAKIGLTMGSKAVNSSFGKKWINKGINNIPNIFKYEVSKIKNKNIKRAVNSDIANMVVDEGQNKINKKISGSLFS